MEVGDEAGDRRVGGSRDAEVARFVLLLSPAIVADHQVTLPVVFLLARPCDGDDHVAGVCRIEGDVADLSLNHLVEVGVGECDQDSPYDLISPLIGDEDGNRESAVARAQVWFCHK